MAATVDISETNGASPGTRTESITHSNYGSVDSVNLDAVAAPLAPSTNSFQKWQNVKLTALGGSTNIKNIKYYASGDPASGATAKFNGHQTQATYDGMKKTTYETPDTTLGDVPATVPIVAPAVPNIGIAGSLTGTLTVAPGYSDFIVSLISCDGSVIAGNTRTITFGYDEVA